VKRILPLVFALVVFTAAASPGRAAWGWPPPGYSAAGFSACDGSHYRGLWAWLRDRRHGPGPDCVSAGPVLPGPGSSALPVSPGGPASPPFTPQPLAPSGAPHP
jgi:hypothetical protein